MADQNLEKRLAALEKGLAAAESRASKAEERVEELQKENKRLVAQHRSAVVQARAEISSLNSMRDLQPDAYFEDARERYEELKRETVKTKDGMRHYFSPGPSYVRRGKNPPDVYYPPESIISIPADQDPSQTWLPTEVAGKDPKTGALIFVPKGSLNTTAQDLSDEPANQVDEGKKKGTNTEQNDKAAAERKRMAELGAGSARPSDNPVG
jgi:hypothetical protein